MALETIDNEKELLQGIASGDEKAFTALFYGYHNQLAAFVLMITQSVELTEEIIQDVFVKLWQTKQELPYKEKFTAYLFILARNYTLNCIRKEANIRRHEKQYGVYAGETGLLSEDLLKEHPEYLTLIDRAVAQLPPQQQKVFVLSRMDGLKHAEIAAQMGISKETVKKYIQWANQSVIDFVKTHQKIIALLVLVNDLGNR